MDNFDQVREVTKTILEGAGYNVTPASNIGDAFQSLSKKIPDLIVSEIELPGIGGVGLYNRLKKNEVCKNIPFVFLTNYDAKKIQPKIQKYQDIVVPKSDPWREILLKLENFLQTREKRKSSTKNSNSAQKNTGKKEETNLRASKEKSVTKTLEKNTQAARQPKEIQIQSSAENSKAKKKKRRPNVQNQVSPGCSTQHFSMPSSIFDAKSMGNLFSSLFRSCKKGNLEEFKKIEFNPLVIATDGIKEKLKAKSSYLAKKEEALFQELKMEESVEYLFHQDDSKQAQYLIEDEDILVELSDDLNDVDLTQEEMISKEETDRIPYKEVPLVEQSKQEYEYSIQKEQEETSKILLNSDEKAILMQHKMQDQESLVEQETRQEPIRHEEGIDKILEVGQEITEQESSSDIEDKKVKQENLETEKIRLDLAIDKLEEIGHNLFSMAGLCLQMFSLDFNVETFTLETKEKNILFSIKDENFCVHVSNKSNP